MNGLFHLEVPGEESGLHGGGVIHHGAGDEARLQVKFGVPRFENDLLHVGGFQFRIGVQDLGGEV